MSVEQISERKILYAFSYGRWYSYLITLFLLRDFNHFNLGKLSRYFFLATPPVARVFGMARFLLGFFQVFFPLYPEDFPFPETPT
ncbi:hypothetical protein KCA24_36405, partial [Escherichia coli]|nr:hypothetical protein [Escherichia coli]